MRSKTLVKGETAYTEVFRVSDTETAGLEEKKGKRKNLNQTVVHGQGLDNGWIALGTSKKLFFCQLPVIVLKKKASIKP